METVVMRAENSMTPMVSIRLRPCHGHCGQEDICRGGSQVDVKQLTTGYLYTLGLAASFDAMSITEEDSKSIYTGYH